MNIVVLAASGRTGHALVREALARGHIVTALVRDPARLQVAACEALRVVQADVRDPLSVQHALGEGAIVLSGLGVTQRDDAGVLTAGARVLLIAAPPARVVWLGAYGSGRSARAAGWLTRSLLKLMGERLADKVSADEAILQYGGTVFHAGLLSNDARSETRQTFALESAPRRLFPGRVSRATVAAAMLDEAESPRFAGGIAVPVD
jgi:uncharacterized protein